MPLPRPPAPIAAAVAAQGLRVDQVDPDLLCFLQHVRPDGNSYAVDLPARSKSPPVTVKYEPGPETPARNGEAQSALVPSPAPEGRGRPVVEEEIPWYETIPMYEEYRQFWRQTRMVNGTLVLHLEEGKVVRYELDPAPVRLRDIADWAQKNGWAQEKDGEEVAAVAALEEDDDGVRAGKKEKVMPSGWAQEKDGEEVAAVAALGEDDDGVRAGKKEKVTPNGWAQEKDGEEVAAVAALGEDDDGVRAGKKEKVTPIRTEGPVLESRVRDSPARRQKKKVEQGQEEKGKGKAGAEKIKVVKRGRKMLNELPVKTLNTVNTKTDSSNGHDAKPHSASGFIGVVWPLHIMERPESSFKEKLLRVLRKPFCMVEYEEKLHDATINRPSTKLRQTRGGVKYYNSTHETSQSYFDSFPDLAELVVSTGYPNQLALLRGFYFWLLNVSDEDQFRPWSDDFKKYTIIPLE